MIVILRKTINYSNMLQKQSALCESCDQTLSHIRTHLVSHHQWSLARSSLYVTLIPSSVRSRYIRRVKNGWTVRSLAPMRIITDNPC